MKLVDLFFAFLQVGLFSIGGGYAALPLIQEQVVNQHKWLSLNEFTHLITIAEMTPGPIAINAATFVGTRLAGWVGALIATLGCIMPALWLVSLLAFIYFKYKNLAVLQTILATVRPAVVGLIAAAAMSMLVLVIFPSHTLVFAQVNWLGCLLFIGAFLLLRYKHYNPIIVMLVCGVINLLLGLLFQS